MFRRPAERYSRRIGLMVALCAFLSAEIALWAPAIASDSQHLHARKSVLAMQMPAAVDDYKQGMRFFLGDGVPKDLNAAETLFRRAAAAGLPHGAYGIACVLYRRHDPLQAKEARKQMAYAALHDVLEAKADMVSYYDSGFGDAPYYEAAQVALLDLIKFTKSLPPEAGDPEYAYDSKPGYALSLARDELKSGRCAPIVDDLLRIRNFEPPQPLLQLLAE